MKYSAPFIFLLLSFPLYSMDTEEGMFEGQRREEQRTPQRPQRPQKQNQLCGQETMRMNAQARRATIKIEEGAKELKKLEKERAEHERRKRRQTIRLEQQRYQPRKEDQKSTSAPELRKKRRGLFGHLTHRVVKKLSSNEGSDSHHETSHAEQTEPPRKWHSVDDIWGNVQQEEKERKEDNLHALQNRLTTLEKRMSVTLSSPIQIEGEPSEIEAESSDPSENGGFQSYSWPPTGDGTNPYH